MTALVEAAGFAVREADGIGAVAELVPEAAVESPGRGPTCWRWRPPSAGTPRSAHWRRTCTSSPSCRAEDIFSGF